MKNENDVIRNRCYYVQKGHGFRENLVSAMVSTFLIFMSVDQLLLVDLFSQLYYLTYAKKQQCRTWRYKSLKSWKIDTIDLTQQFSLSIFTDFRYQSIKITWLLSIFIDWLLRVVRERFGRQVGLVGFWRCDTGTSWRYRKITSTSFDYKLEAKRKVLKDLRRWRMSQTCSLFCEAGSCLRYLEISFTYCT